jgi:lipopolysaccharide/colanic/teichoic acid biosynthesis glycosyltransferase
VNGATVRRKQRPLHAATSRTKRATDVSLAFAGLLLASPLIAALAGAIRLIMGPPVLFRQVRPGLNGRPFVLIKFRTMRHAQDGRRSSSTDRERLTRFGAFLRRTSLDELPELANVLRGDMSLVGPRPLLTAYLDRYTPEQARRHLVKPGITGWAQVHGRNAISWDEKFAYDVWYVDNWSLRLDLRILWMTVKQVAMGTGIHADGHATTPDFERVSDPRALP